MFLSNSYYFNSLFKKLAWIKTLKHEFISVTLCLIWSNTSFIFQQDEESDEPEDPEGFKVEIILFVVTFLRFLLLATYSFSMPFLSQDDVRNDDQLDDDVDYLEDPVKDKLKEKMRKMRKMRPVKPDVSTDFKILSW